MLKALAASLSIALSLSACTKPSPSHFDAAAVNGHVQVLSNSFTDQRAANQKAIQTAQQNYTQDQLQKALRVVAQVLVSRDPTQSELAQLSSGFSGYDSVIKSYFKMPAFQQSMLSYYRTLFEMGGMGTAGQPDANTNYDEPSNLAVYVIFNDRPWSEMLTADYCVDNNFNKGNCAAFGGDASKAALYGAGAITTQAFLHKWSASFNFRRVKKATKVFLCKDYPDNADDGLTEADISATVKTFNCTTCTPACYSCHRGLNPRASLFYTFDRTGVYNPAIMNASLGQSQNPMVANVTDAGTISYLPDILNAGATPRYHGRSVASVKELGAQITQDKSFRDCLAQRLTNFMMGHGPYDAFIADFQNVRDDVALNGFNVKSILLEIAEHPAFVLRNDVGQ